MSKKIIARVTGEHKLTICLDAKYEIDYRTIAIKVVNDGFAVSSILKRCNTYIL